MKDYKFTCVPKNLMLALDGNCKVMLFTLIQFSDYASGEDGWFYAPNTTLQTQAGLSKNLVIATLDTLYRAGIIDIKCIGVGTGHRSNRIKVNTSSFDKYDEYKVEDILGNPELQIRTVDYKNNYSPSYLQESKKVCKEVCKKVNTIIDNIENIDNIKLDNSVLNNKPIEEKEMKQPTQELVQGGSPSNHLNDFTVEDINQLPYMERVLEKKYQRILKNIPGVENTHPGAYIGDGLPNYTREVSDFIQHHDTTAMTNLFVEWYDGGREKIAELVQGLSQQAIDGILKHYNNEAARLEPVYSI